MAPEEELLAAKIVRHKRKGDVYDVLYKKVTVKTKLPLSEGDNVVVYMHSDDGQIYARPVDEFCDKFEPVA